MYFLRIFCRRCGAALIFIIGLVESGTCQNIVWQKDAETPSTYFLDNSGSVIQFFYGRSDSVTILKRSSQNGEIAWTTTLTCKGNGNNGHWVIGKTDHSNNLYFYEAYMYNDVRFNRMFKIDPTGKVMWITNINHQIPNPSMWIDVHGKIRLAYWLYIPNQSYTAEEAVIDLATGALTITPSFFKEGIPHGLTLNDDGYFFYGSNIILGKTLTGEDRWSFGLPKGMQPSFMCADDQGNLYVAGEYQEKNTVMGAGRYIDTLICDRFGVVNGYCQFLMKIKSRSGELRWAKRIDSWYLNSLKEMYLDRSGNLFLYGRDVERRYTNVVNVNTRDGRYDTVSYREPEALLFFADPSGDIVTVKYSNGSQVLTKLNAFKPIVFSEKQKPVEVFPNPVEDYINICMNREMTGMYKVELFNASGIRMMIYESKDDELQINCSLLVEGLYILKLTEADGSETIRKIIK